jgi:type IV secretion system protein VirB8
MSATTQTPSLLARLGRRPVARADLPMLAADARSLQAKEARNARLAARGWRWATFGLGAVALAEAIGIVSTLPLIRVVPVMVTMRADGSWETSVAWSNLPRDAQEANVLTLLWQYVRLREGYSSGEAGYAWDVVSAMSDKPVREQFQEWFKRENPNSPQRLYGQRTVVRVNQTGTPVRRRGDDAVRFDFYRTEIVDGREGPPKLYTVTLRYRLVESVPAWQRLQFNPAGVIVWEYPGATEATGGNR